MRTEHSDEAKESFYEANPNLFQGQLWERCRCGREPVNMPSHLCIDCLMDRQDHPRIQTGNVPHDSVEPNGAR